MTIKRIAKYCSVAVVVVLVVITALGPANWQPRTGLGCDALALKYWTI